MKPNRKRSTKPVARSQQNALTRPDSSLKSAVTLETLEHRQLLATINVADFGAIPNDGINDTAKIQNAINASASGDTIQFNAGRYDIGELMLKSSRNYKGVAGSILRSSGTEFGQRIEFNGKDINVSTLRFEGAGVFMGNGGTYRNIKFTDNVFADMNAHAFKMTNESDQVVIERNTFQNINGYGVIESFYTNRMSYRFNRIIDSTHGGHFLAPLNDNNISFNHMTGLTSMGLEIQSHANSVSRNLLVEGNVIYDWRSTNSAAMGISNACPYGINTQIKNNYIRASLAPGHNWIPAPDRLPAIGHLIELMYDQGYVRGNVMGGTYYFPIGAGTRHAPPAYVSVIETNTMHGNSIVGLAPITGQPSGNPNIPTASWSIGVGNSFGLPANQMPAPDAWITTIAQMSGQTTVPAPVVNSSELLYQTSPHELRIGFDQSVGTSFTNSDLTVRNVTTNQPIAAQIVSNTGNQTFVIRFPGNNVLPDGNYVATIGAGSVTNLSGVSNTSAQNVAFFFLQADANRDRKVDAADVTIMRANFGRPGNFAQGDFTYDGKVNLNDFNVLARRYGQTMLASVGSSGIVFGSGDSSSDEKTEEDALLQQAA